MPGFLLPDAPLKSGFFHVESPDCYDIVLPLYAAPAWRTGGGPSPLTI